MTRLACLVLLVGFFAGCTALPGLGTLTSGLLPSFACKGKGSFTGTAMGGASLIIDCGDGLLVQQLQPATTEPK